jgi:hypothetical protein
MARSCKQKFRVPQKADNFLTKWVTISLSKVSASYYFFNSNSGGWSPAGSIRNVGHKLAYCTRPGWLWWWRIWWNDDWQRKPKYGENRPQCHFVHHKSHMTWPGANPGRRDGKPATNRLSYGTDLLHTVSYWTRIWVYISSFVIFVFATSEHSL